MLPGYLATRKRSRQREQLLLRLRDDLDALYRSRLPAEKKTERKHEIFETASAAYQQLDVPNGDVEFPPSNAFVLSLARYHEYQRLLMNLQLVQGGKPSDLVAYLKRLPETRDPVPIIQEDVAARAP